ncbi:MAG: DegT/DnrJ/EryC1/StrS aminotransferase family protein [Elusimicrobia bacterium]|nr:DegT/DnrJ/EryC1/StrS aminotransferase family protein [Elusimicrobiota bacterium]
MTSAELDASVYAPPAAPPWRLEDFFPGTPVRYFSFARRATAAGLQAAKIGAGDAVLVPEFICRDFLSAVRAVGARALFYPVDKTLRPAADPRDWPSARAVVAVNYFGFAQDLAPFERYRQRTGALIVEDNAHGLFSRDAQGRWLGSRGDLGVFSLRKTLPLSNGAALTLNAKDRPWHLSPQSAFADSGGLKAAFRGGVRWLARAAGARSAYRALEGLRRLRQIRTGHRLPPGDPESEVQLPFPELPCRELEAPLTLAGAERETARRRELYRDLSNELRGQGFELVYPDLPAGTVPFGLAVRLPETERGRAFALLARRGLEPLAWPDLPSSVAAGAPDHYRAIHIVHFLW